MCFLKRKKNQGNLDELIRNLLDLDVYHIDKIWNSGLQLSFCRGDS